MEAERLIKISRDNIPDGRPQERLKIRWSNLILPKMKENQNGCIRECKEFEYLGVNIDKEGGQ